MLQRLRAAGGRAAARRGAARRGDAGFTLVELQVVLVVLGVLSGAAVAAAHGVDGRAATTACRLEVASVEIASTAYVAEHGRYATAIDDPAHTPTTLVGAGYLSAAPKGTGYTITYNPADGSVQGTVGATSCTRR